MATITVSRTLFGIALTTTDPSHPAIARIRRLPRDLWIGPVPGSAEREWLVALDKRILPTMRQLFKLADTEFSSEALAALKELRDSTPGSISEPVQGTSSRTGTEVHPGVCAPLRSLGPTLDPSSSGACGAESPGATAAPLSEDKQP